MFIKEKDNDLYVNLFHAEDSIIDESVVAFIEQEESQRQSTILDSILTFNVEQSKSPAFEDTAGPPPVGTWANKDGGATPLSKALSHNHPHVAALSSFLPFSRRNDI